MSAWHLPTIHMTLVRNGLVSLLGEEKANTVVKKWCKINAYAIGYRYGKRVIATKLSPTILEVPNTAAVFNMIRCVQYQCAEGDVDTKYAKDWKEMNFILGQLAINLYESSSMNQNLPWAICEKSEITEFAHCVSKPKLGN